MKMQLKILCILLLRIYAIAARLPIPLTENSKVKNTTEKKIALPQGFNPEPSPMKPLLYPFVTAQPGTVSGWKPIINHWTTTISPVRRSFIIDDRRLAPTISLERPKTDLATPNPSAMHSVVYGIWKSERPMEPKGSQHKLLLKTQNENQSENQNQNLNQNEKTLIDGTKTTYKNIIRRRLGGFIEDTETVKDSFERSENSESKESVSSINSNRPQKKYGRRKIANFNENKITEFRMKDILESHSGNFHNEKAQNENENEKQIIDSAEPAITNKKPIDEPYAPKLPNFGAEIQQWPQDFIATSEGNRSLTENENSQNQNLFANIFGDNSDQQQQRPSNIFNLDDLLSSTASLNITKMGVPYEDQNSAEEPTLCVPLSVREQSASIPTEIVDVERIYCFPLPPSSSDRKDVNENETNDNTDSKSLDFDDFSTPSKSVRIKGIMPLMILCVLALIIKRHL